MGFVSGSVGNVLDNSPDAGMPAWLNKISCRGSEDMLVMCDHGPWDHYDCAGQDNAVSCGKHSVRLSLKP